MKTIITLIAIAVDAVAAMDNPSSNAPAACMNYRRILVEEP